MTQRNGFTQDDQALIESITEYMGGMKALRLMVSANGFYFDSEEKTFRFQFKGSRKFNICTITLDKGQDLFTFKLWQFSKKHCSTRCKVSHDGLYCDMLKKTFEQETGLSLTVPNIIFRR